MKWAVGVTTIPERRDKLLPDTLASLRNAGFTVDRLFVDGDKDAASWEREFGIETVCRWPRILPYGNWGLGLAELFIRHPTADRFAMFQDDIKLVSHLREYLERITYPDGPAPQQPQGYWNLYTNPISQKTIPFEGQTGRQKFGWFPSPQRGQGALGLVFSRQATLMLLTHQTFLERPLDPHRGWRSFDGGIVWAMNKAKYQEFVHNPSLCIHTGSVSSVDKRKHSVGTEVDFPRHVWHEKTGTRLFPGETFDALSLL